MTRDEADIVFERLKKDGPWRCTKNRAGGDVGREYTDAAKTRRLTELQGRMSHPLKVLEVDRTQPRR